MPIFTSMIGYREWLEDLPDDYDDEDERWASYKRGLKADAPQEAVDAYNRSLEEVAAYRRMNYETTKVYIDRYSKFVPWLKEAIANPVDDLENLAERIFLEEAPQEVKETFSQYLKEVADSVKHGLKKGAPKEAKDAYKKHLEDIMKMNRQRLGVK